ncbi:hypothetical protein DERF_013519 [Dermatophagoides farinae]|uniref:Serine/threonine specific protein phosphatases domain-containing protein n=1 Tax=Dermatophagoides farinae TaxID=6954 RepID=A0A922HPQ0_DERFA|nr:hypothetical protein DERF_013519 [Dermatophagoides farinae]
MASDPSKQQQQQQPKASSTTDDDVVANATEPSLTMSKSLTSIGFATCDREIEDEQIANNSNNNNHHNINVKSTESILPSSSLSTSSNSNEQSMTPMICHCENHDIPKDILCIILICPQHQTIALQQIIDYYYFPSTPLTQPNQSISETISSLFDLMIFKNNNNIDTNKQMMIHSDLVHMYRIKVPKIRRFITKWIYYSQLINSNNTCICNVNDDDTISSTSNDEITWLPIAKLPSIFTTVWGGEIIQYFNNDKNFWTMNFIEVNYEEIIEEELPKIEQSWQSDCAINLSIAAEYLYNEFFIQCHPSSTMSLASFHLFCDKLDWFVGTWYKESRIKIFRHLDRQNRGYLEYRDLLNGLAEFNLRKTDENPFSDFPFFEEIYKKFNCRNIATTVQQKLVDNTIYYGRCDSCLFYILDTEFPKYNISSLLTHIGKSGEIIKVLKFKPNFAQSESVMTFIDDIQNRNIFNLANEFINRIGKIQTCKDQLESNLESIENYYFENRSIMLHYLRMILEFAKRLFENESPILELQSPAYIFGYLNGSIEDLFMFNRNIFKTFPFIVPSVLLFMGNYLQNLDNLDCLIYLLCMKILMPTKVFLLSGHNEMKLANLPEDDDIIRNLIKQIYGLLPIACIIGDQLIVANFSIPTISTFKLKIMATWSRSMIPFNNVGKIYYKYDLIENSRHCYQQYTIFDRKHSPLYEDLIDELMTKSMMIDNEENNNNGQQSIASQQTQMLKFIAHNHLFISIHSNWKTYGKETNDNEGFDFPTDNTYDLTTILSTRKLTNDPTCIFIDQNILRFICME